MIKKNEAGVLTENDELEVQRIEEIIDDKIKLEYVKGRAVNIQLERFPSKRVMNALIQKAYEAGWDIRFREDQREGGVYVDVK